MSFLQQARFARGRFAEALSYWDSKRRGRLMPSRRDIDPLEIPSLLRNVVLIDVSHDPLDFRYRLIGTAIVARIKADYTGKRFMDLPHQRPGSRVWSTAARLAEERRPLFGSVPYTGGDPAVRDCQDLHMPLSDDGETVNMVFGLIEFALRP